jgi:5-methylcytosine-specific restriction enzyme A
MTLHRPPVEATPRKAFTKAQRAAAFLAAAGKCELCAVKIQGRFDIDHRIPLHHSGDHAPSNWQVLCPPCHRQKTKGDVKVSAKIKRIHARENGTRRERKAIQSPGFDKKLTKGFDGVVRLRTALLASMTLGICVGIVGAAYVAGVAAARSASYSERPPERYIVPGQLIAVELLPNVMAVHYACRLNGLPALEKRTYYGCAWPNRVILPDPCDARDPTAKTVCGLIRAELACHEWAHAAGGWPGDHRR